MAKYTLRQASEITGKSELTLRRQIKAGKLKAHMEYDRWLIDENDMPIPKKALQMAHDMRKHADKTEDYLSIWQADTVLHSIAHLFFLFKYFTPSNSVKTAWEQVELELKGIAHGDLYEEKVLVALQKNPQVANRIKAITDKHAIHFVYGKEL